MSPIQEFLTRKFLNWQSEAGEIKAIQEFAIYLEVNRSLLSFWMNGAREPNDANIAKLAKRLGYEVYDVMNKERPNPYLERANRLWEYIPEERQKQIAEEAEQYAAQNQVQRIEKNHQRRKARKAQ